MLEVIKSLPLYFLSYKFLFPICTQTDLSVGSVACSSVCFYVLHCLLLKDNVYRISSWTELCLDEMLQMWREISMLAFVNGANLSWNDLPTTANCSTNQINGFENWSKLCFNFYTCKHMSTFIPSRYVNVCHYRAIMIYFYRGAYFCCPVARSCG